MTVCKPRGRHPAAPRFFGVFVCACSLAVMPLSACRRGTAAEPAVSVEEEISPQPVRVGPAMVAVRLTDARRTPVQHASITVEADMSHPGMSPVFANARELPYGSYQAPLNFAMAGDWVVLLHIKLPDGQTLERSMDVRGVRAN